MSKYRIDKKDDSAAFEQSLWYSSVCQKLRKGIEVHCHCSHGEHGCKDDIIKKIYPDLHLKDGERCH